MVMILQPPPIRGLSQTGGFELMIEDRSGKGVEELQRVVDRFQDEARKRPELAGVFSTFSARVPQLKFDVDRTKARRLDVPITDLFATLQANLGGYYVNDFDLYGKVWKVMVQAEGGVRTKPEDIPFNLNGALPELGGFSPNGFNVSFADGAVRFISKSINPTGFKSLITRAGGEVIEFPH